MRSARSWAPLRLCGVTLFPLWLEGSRESPEWMGQERWGEESEVLGPPEAAWGGRAEVRGVGAGLQMLGTKSELYESPPTPTKPCLISRTDKGALVRPLKTSL